MVTFANNKWDDNEVADNLSKQLFTKKNPRKKRLNLDRNPPGNKKLKNTPERSSKKSQNFESKFHNKNEKFKPRKQKSTIESAKNNHSDKLEASGENNESKRINEERKSRRSNKKNRINKNKGEKENPVPNLNTKMKQDNSKFAERKTERAVEKLKLMRGKINVQKIEQLLALKNRSIDKKKDKNDKPESLRERMVAQLRASRFRFLNETLYKNDSTVAKQMFKDDPDAFMAYHTGYQRQVSHWPLNPLDVIISAVKKMPKDYIIADFGCGEGKLADSVSQKVHSFDLVAVNEKIIACDMAHTPLLMGGTDVVVFCLSLMGTNLNDYLREANRVLKKNGILKIAEVESRFVNLTEFIKLLESYGFKNTWKDFSHNLFYFMDFIKIGEINRKTSKLPEIALKPCLYKKR